MRRRSVLPFSVLAAIAAGGLVAAGSAQIVEGVDAGAIRARAKTEAKDFDAFTREIAKRGEALREDAVTTKAGAAANRARIGSVKTGGGKGPFDFDEMIAQADAAAAGGKRQQPRFIAFASMSMAPASLKTLMRDVTRAGGVVVFRGFQNNSVKAFMTGIGKAVDKGQKLDGVGIDPRLFRAFNVTAVPTYAVVSSDFEPCDGFHCTTDLPPHDQLSGNVTTEYALQTFASGRGPGAASARIYLEKLRRGGKG